MLSLYKLLSTDERTVSSASVACAVGAGGVVTVGFTESSGATNVLRTSFSSGIFGIIANGGGVATVAEKSPP